MEKKKAIPALDGFKMHLRKPNSKNFSGHPCITCLPTPPLKKKEEAKHLQLLL